MKERARSNWRYWSVVIGAIFVVGLAWYYLSLLRTVKREPVRELHQVVSAQPKKTMEKARKKHAEGSVKEPQKRTMKFLELALQFFPIDAQQGLRDIIKNGAGKEPDEFAELSIKYMDMYAFLKKQGKLHLYYEALKMAHQNNPDDINVLRILAAVASIPSLGKMGEYEGWLEELAMRDTREDVLFPLMEIYLNRGEKSNALGLVRKCVEDHPEQSQVMLMNSLRVFCENENGTDEMRSAVVGMLKAKNDLNPFVANCCADSLFGIQNYNDAEVFYRQCYEKTDSNFQKELCEARLDAIKIQQGRHNDETVASLLRLAEKSHTPKVKKEATRLLVSLRVDLPWVKSTGNNN